ncbi:MAG TPA: class I SAM-dependent methyltransferase [Gaiellaceae bacterium]|nr:class I SAM-dependent methyltransferase [Gaiellaceae bacterium]
MGEEHAWNAAAEVWVDEVRRGDRGPVHLHDDVLRELLPPPRGLTVDAGSGEGRWTRELRERGHDVLGVDRSEKLVELAREADPDGRYEIGALEQLPLADSSAALVLTVNVLPHVVELEPVVAEFARVLEPGGVLLIGTIHPVMEASTFDEETEEFRMRSYFAAEEHAVPLGHHHVFHQHRTLEGYLRPLLAAGFAFDDIREVPGRTGKLPRYLVLRLTRR